MPTEIEKNFRKSLLLYTVHDHSKGCLVAWLAMLVFYKCKRFVLKYFQLLLNGNLRWYKYYDASTIKKISPQTISQ